MHGIRHSIADLVPTGGSVIDIGCGTGEQSALLANDGRQVVGIDASPAMLTIAEKRNSANTAFILGSGSDTNFPDGNFSAAILSFVLHETDPLTRVALLSEAKRLVGKHGYIVIAEYQPPKSLWGKFLSLGLHFVERLAGGGHYEGYRDWMKNGGFAGFCGANYLLIHETRKHFASNIVVARCSAREATG